MKNKLLFASLGLLLGSTVQAGIVLNGSNANLVVEANATLVTDGMKNGGVITNNGVIDNKGNWENTGTAYVDNLVKFTGTSAQTISGTSAFETVHVDNASGVSLAGGADVSINTVLQLKEGVFTTTGGLLTFLSTAVDHCAFIDNFSGIGWNGTVAGNVDAQRYHASASGTFNQHLMGSPVNAGAFSDFIGLSGANGVAVTPTADCDETQLEPTSNYGTVFEYDESLVTFCSLEGWIVRSSGSMDNGKGYGVAIAGAGTATVTGVPNLNASYTQGGLGNSNWAYTSLQSNSYNSGWHLLANPYLASFDLDATSNSDFDNYVQIMNTFGGFAGTYQPLGMNSSDLLPPFQAFMVRKSAPGAGTFSFDATDRSVGTETFQKPRSTEGLDVLVEGNGFADITRIRFDEDATVGYDTDLDAFKLPSKHGQPTLFTENDGEWSSINSKPDVASTPFIPMGFQPGTSGTYTFNVQNLNLPTGVTAVLEDVQLGVFQSLNSNPIYSFYADASDNWNRFIIHFTSTITDVRNAERTEDVKIWSDGTNVMVLPAHLQNQAELTVFNAVGQVIATGSVMPHQQTTIDLSDKAAGVVIVQVRGHENTYSQKVVLTK